MTGPAPAPAPAPPTPAPPPAPVPAPPPEFKPPASQEELDRLISEREHRVRAKYDGLSPEKFAELKAAAAKAAEQDAANATDAEKREKAAREAAAAEADAKYRPQVARAEFKAAAVGRIDASKVEGILAPFGDMSYFLTDSGEVDTAKIKAYIDSIAPATTKTPPPKGPVVPGHTPGGPPPAVGGDSARKWLEKQGIKVD